MSNPTVAGFRLSTQQERIWSQQVGAATRFWAECELAISGPLDEEKLHTVIRQLVQRHEILRTAFHRQTGVSVPFQVILDEPVFDWTKVDFIGAEAAAACEGLRKVMAERKANADLEHGPVLLVVLARMALDEHRLVLSLPALCVDRRSLLILTGEIAQGYSGTLSPHDEVMQYADVAAWQQELLASEESKAARDYWRDYCRQMDLTTIQTALGPFERRLAGEFRPEALATHIDIESLGSFADMSVADFVLTAWLVFVSRMTGRAGVTVGCQLDGRNYSEFGNALGTFARTLPLTVECSGSESFGTFLDTVRRNMADFRTWQDSFTWTATLYPGEDPAPLLPVAFEYCELLPPQEAAGIRINSLRHDVCDERYTIKLDARQRGSQLELVFRFDGGRIDRQSIALWASNFLVLLRAAAADPAKATHRLSFLAEAGREKLLVSWNHTVSDFPRTRCIHQLFEVQAARTPEAPAVRFQNDCLTYQELNARANRLAHHLRSKGVGADSLVGLCVERSIDVMVALLAILKAGGAYVPLSAEHPKPRLAQQLSGVAVLITEGKFECLMPEFGGDTVLLNRDHELWAQQAVSNPEPLAGPDNLVYVIYTSGSTGMPKGVAVRHRNLVNYTTFIQRLLKLENEAKPLHFATVSTLGADLGNTCIYPSLVSGGCLHVIASDVAADSQRMREYTAKHPVDVLKIVPSHLTALLNAGGGKEILPRRFLITGGEALTVALLDKINATRGSCEVVNHYGPTETTVGSLTLSLRGFDYLHSSAQTIPIGRPIANTRVYIFDSHGEPVPVGVAGELYIAGDGVTAGYIGQPELTSERFVPERFGPDPSGKMYRTGDLARYLPDGNVEFLGRADDQVKIRGFRIELGEIESVLSKHTNVQQAAVLAIADERGDRSLVAYIVGSATADELRIFLRSQVPEYMVPSSVLTLPKMPLNANGKIDRQALPRPEDIRGAPKETIAPRTPSEEVVGAIWAEVLKRDDLSVDDNFFEIGGHSLLATQIASRLREHFKIPVPVRAVFESPSIAQLAERMDQSRREEQGMLPPPITAVPRNGGLPLSYAQERLWVLDQIEPNNPLYNIPRTLRLRGALRVDALERALNEIVRRHESQRTSFSKQDGHPVQVIAPAMPIPLDIRDLTPLPADKREEEARRLAIAEIMRPFDLSLTPLVRALLVRLDMDDHVLQLTMHHIISDAWSAGIFLQELTALYEAFSIGRSSPLPELKVQYADYAAQEREWLKGDVLDKQLSFWRERLQGLPPVIDLPLDHSRPQSRTFAGSCEMLHVPADTLAAIKDLARQEGATLFMSLMAVFQAMLSKYSGEEQIVVGTDLANRTMPETERMIGFFINLMAVRTDLSGNPTFRELLARVRDGLLDSYAHQEVPFPKVVQAVQPERSATHNPIVQVLFVMQNIPRARRELAGLRVEPFEVPITTSKFDMALFVGERPDGLVGYWVYSTELFEQATILRMLRHFTNLLDSVVTQPDTRMAFLAMLSADELAAEEEQKKKRKQSQLGKLKATAPSAVGITGKHADPTA